MTTQTGLARPGRTPRRTELGPLQGLDLHAQYHSTRMGGDIFDAIAVGARVMFLLSDIAGRRTEAHPIAAEVQDTFRDAAESLFGVPDANLMDATTDLVQAINHALIGASDGVHYAPTFVGCFDVQLGLLAYINAGGQATAFRDSDGTRPLPDVAMPMGLFTHLTYEPSMQAFEPGATLLVVTKGVTESMHGHERFGPERVLEVLRESPPGPAADVCKAVLHAANAFGQAGSSRLHALHPGRKDVSHDDLTAMAIKRPAE